MDLERCLARASRWVSRQIHWDRSRTIASGGACWDPRLLGYGASSLSRWLMRLLDPEEVVARRRRNFAQLAALLRGHLSVPFRELPLGTCPLFLPVMVPNKPRFQQELERLGVQSVNLWDASHPGCPPELAAPDLLQQASDSLRVMGFENSGSQALPLDSRCTALLRHDERGDPQHDRLIELGGDRPLLLLREHDAQVRPRHQVKCLTPRQLTQHVDMLAEA